MAATAHKALNAALKQRAFEPVYCLHGDDDFLKDDALRQLIDAAVDPATRDFNLDVRRGAELDAETLDAALNTPPMMAERRVVAVRDPGALKKDARATLDRYVKRPAADTVVVLVVPAGAKPDKALLEQTAAFDFAPLTGDRVPRWITHHARAEFDATVTPEAAALLQSAVGNDLQQLAAELDKLASYVSGGGAAVIDEQAVSAIVGVRRGETLGDLLDAVARRDTTVALGLVEYVLAQPKTSAVTSVMALATQFLALAWGDAMRGGGSGGGGARGTNPGQLARGYYDLLRDGGAYPGRPWNDAVNAWVAGADRWTAPALDRALALLLDADLALKETRLSSDEQLLSTLVLALCATE